MIAERRRRQLQNYERVLQEVGATHSSLVSGLDYAAPVETELSTFADPNLPLPRTKGDETKSAPDPDEPPPAPPQTENPIRADDGV